MKTEKIQSACRALVEAANTLEQAADELGAAQRRGAFTFRQVEELVRREAAARASLAEVTSALTGLLVRP